MVNQPVLYWPATKYILLVVPLTVSQPVKFRASGVSAWPQRPQTTLPLSYSV